MQPDLTADLPEPQRTFAREMNEALRATMSLGKFES